MNSAVSSNSHHPLAAVPGTGSGTRRLDFNRVKFCGRNNELDLFLDALDRITNAHVDPMPSSIFLQGDAGSGKSTLVFAFRNTVLAKREQDRCNNQYSVYEKCCFCRGKFEQGKAAVAPFEAFVQAIQSISKQLCTNEIERKLWQDRFEQEISPSDAKILVEIIPELEHLFLEEEDDEESDDVSVDDSLAWDKGDSDDDDGDGIDLDALGDKTMNRALLPADPIQAWDFNETENEWGFERLRFSLRSFIRAVSKFVPLVFFLDDLHWAGQDSLALIQTLLSDRTLDRRLLFIGAFRPLDTDHPLQQILTDTSLTNSLVYQLPNLDNLGLSEMLASFLLADEQEVRTLCAVVHKKTHGNPFFVVQFLRMLERKQFVYFYNNHWRWRSDLVLNEAEIPNSVVEIVAEEIKAMPKEYHVALTVASCFGTSFFDVDVLAAVLAALNTVPVPPVLRSDLHSGPDSIHERSIVLARLQTIAERTGFIEASEDNGHFRFAHDRVREGAYSLLDSEQQRIELHLWIGRPILKLWKEKLRQKLASPPQGSDEVYHDRILLLACQQLGLAAKLIEDMGERIEVAEIHFAAAMVAARRSAFFPASQFLKTGLLLLVDRSTAKQISSVEASMDLSQWVNAWKDHYDLMLKMSTAKTRMEFNCGNLIPSIAYADDVINNAHTIHEKKAAYMTKILCLVQDEKPIEARNLVLFVLAKNFGCAFPYNCGIVHVMIEFLKTEWLLYTKSENELRNLPVCEDPIADMKMQFLLKLAELAFFSSNPNMYLLASSFSCALRTTIKEGRSFGAAHSFAAYSWIKAQQGNYEKATRLGKISAEYVRSQKVVTADDNRASTIYHYFIRHWKHPYHESLAFLDKTMRSYWHLGAMESLFVDTHMYLNTCLISGERLPILREKQLKYASTLEDYSKSLLYYYHAPPWQTVSNLMGISEYETKLIGEFIDEDKLLEMPDKLVAHRVYVFNLFLSCFFGDFKFARTVICKLDDPFAEGPHAFVPLRLFFDALTFLALKRLPKSGSWRDRCCSRRRGRRGLHQLKKMVSTGAVNCVPLLALLKAEDAASRVGALSVRSVTDMFDKAIEEAMRLEDGYYLHLKALSNERAAMFCIEVNELDQAAEYLAEAQEFHMQWGAAAKVRQIQLKYEHILAQKSGGTVMKQEEALRLIQLHTNQAW